MNDTKYIINEIFYEHQYLTPPIDDYNLPIFVEKQEYRHSGTLFPIHWHEQLELIYVLDGDLVISGEGDIQWVHQHDLMLINPGEIHHIESTSTYSRYYCVIIDPMFLSSSYFDSCESNYLLPLFSSKIKLTNRVESQDSKDYFLQLINLFQQRPKGFELGLKGLIYMFLSTLFSQTSIAEVPSPLMSVKKQSYVKNALKFIHDNYTLNFTLEDLGAQLHVSHFYIAHLFKTYTGTSIQKYLIEYRLKRSLIQLIHSDTTIIDIAMANGFNDPNYFSRQFKKVFNLSPLQYRQKHK